MMEYNDLYYRTRRLVFEDLSRRQGMFCTCGRLATGLHEMNCAKFNKRVDKETKRLLEP